MSLRRFARTGRLSRPSRRGAVLAAVIGLASGHREASAAARNDKAACSTALETARREASSGRLLEARAAYVGCAKAVCGATAQNECATAFTRLNSQDIPTVVVRTTDGEGRVRRDVAVRMDGELVASGSGDAALQVNPGMHEFTFEVAPQAIQSLKVLVSQGARNVPVSMVLRSPDAAPSPVAIVAERQRPEVRTHEVASGLPYAVVGAALAGSGTGMFLASRGKQDSSSVAIDVSVGASVTALVIAAWLFAGPRTKVPAEAAVTNGDFELHASSKGAFASITQSF